MNYIIELSPFVKNFIVDNAGTIKVVVGILAYSTLEYYLGKTDKVKEGSLPEYLWARVKSIFNAFKGQ